MKVKKIVIVLMCLLVSVVSCSPNAESIYSSKFDSSNSSGNIGSSDILHPSSSGYPPISSPSSSTDTNSDSSSNSSPAPVIHTAEIRYDGTISNLYEGNTKQFYFYVDESPVYSASWTSSNNDVASIDSNGLLTAVSPGSTEITGSFYIDNQVVSDTLFVTVLHRTIYPDSISLNSSNLELKIDETYQLSATVSPENADDKSVEWSSSDDIVATIDNNGLVHAISRGEAVITATTCNDVVATCTIKVIEPSITITNVETTLYEQDTLQLETSLIDLPSDSVITYVSDDDSIAAINSNGVVTAVHEGQVTITASVVYNGTTYEDSITLNILHLVIDPLSISLNATNLELDVNDTYQFSAEVLPENADDKTVTWSSTDEDVIEVDDNGLAAAIGAGDAKVIATLSNGINCSCDITVYKPTLSINPVEDTTLLVDDTIQLSVELYRISNAVIDWTSSDDQIATVDANGLVTALKAGNVAIEASCTYKGTLYKDSISFIINQPSIEIEEMSDNPIFIGDSVTLNCSTQYLDEKITWSSSDEAIATINEDGVLTAISEGEVTIVASCGKYSDSITITINNNRDTYYTDGLYFMRLNDSYYVSAYLGDSKVVYIPSTYNELPVSMIGVNVFKGNSSIEQIYLTKNITSISDNAFANCTNLTSIFIPESVSEISNNAFSGCSKSLKFYSQAVSQPTGWNIDLSSYTYVFWNVSGLSDDGFWYTILDSTNSTYKVSIRGVNKSAKNITIPNSLKIDSIDYEVSEIADKAFYSDDDLVSISIANTVVSIGNNTFYETENLTSVTFVENSNLTSIGEYAFYSCYSLISIYIPSSVTSVDSYAFQDCYSLTIYCEAPSKPSCWNSDWNSDNCPVVWSSYLGLHGEYGDFSYVILKDSNGNKYIEITEYNGSETKVEIPETFTIDSENIPVKSIGDSTFYNYDSLTSIYIPDSVVSIGSYAFYSCDSLTSIYIPDSVTSIGSSAFRECYSLTIYCEASKPNRWDSGWNWSNRPVVWSSYLGMHGEYDDYTYVILKDSNGNKYIEITKYTGSEATVIIPVAFTIDGEDIPVKSIGNSAFNGCTNLVVLQFDDNCKLIKIGNAAFRDCTNLTVISIPSSVTTIGDNAFANCDSLTSIYIPDSVTSIGKSAFYSCDSLTSIIFDENGKLASIGNAAFGGCTNLTTISIPSSVTTIGDLAFRDCTNLTSVIFGENSTLTSIGESAFYNCDSLTSIYIPDSVTSIGSSIFIFCDGSLTIYCEAPSQPNGWNSNWKNTTNFQVIWSSYLGMHGEYDDYTYVILKDSNGNKYIEITKYNGSESKVIIPAAFTIDGEDIPVKSIGNSAFNGCTNLVVLQFDDNCKLIKIGNSAFYGCTNLTTISIPSSVTTIGDNAFSNCNSLTSIMIPSSVTSIGKSAFYSCDSLTSIVIPSSVTKIGNDAFRECYSLTIYCEVSSEPSGWDTDWNPNNCPVIWGYQGN